MAAKSRKCLLLEAKALGQPTTGQNILLLPSELLLHLLLTDPTPRGREVVSPGAAKVLTLLAVDPDGVAKLESIFGAGSLIPGALTPGRGVDGVVGSPSCSMDSDMAGVSIYAK